MDFYGWRGIYETEEALQLSLREILRAAKKQTSERMISDAKVSTVLRS